MTMMKKIKLNNKKGQSILSFFYRLPCVKGAVSEAD